MPELPEVETVKRTLEPEIVGQVLDTPTLFVKRLLQTPLSSFLKEIPGKRILSLSRRGKFLLVHLSDEKKLVFHLRMEGKLFVVDKERHSLAHLSLFLPFCSSDKGLAFYDVRKFGTCHYLSEKEEGPLSKLGREPFEIKGQELKDKLSTGRKSIKECLLDQHIISGIGNIYADEILFASEISPFHLASKITLRQCERIVEEARRILSLAIANNGSTIRTYKASPTTHGEMQSFLKVYGREGKKCLRCQKNTIQKRVFKGRGTHFCPACQRTGFSVAVTGKIGSGKSLVCHYLKERGLLVLSLDEEVRKIYGEEEFLKEAKKKFPRLFLPKLDKKELSRLLTEDPSFRLRYNRFLYPKLRRRVESFLNDNDGKDKAVEVPLLFDAHFEDLFTFLVGVETTRQVEHLKERKEKDIEERLSFNKINSYDKNRHQLDFILHTDFGKRELKKHVDEILSAMKARMGR